MKTITFFGDSITAGYGLSDPRNQSFPSLLKRRLEAAGYDYNIINEGVSGDTSSTGLLRVDRVLTKRTDVFVIELGANDFIRGLVAETTSKNLQQIINKVKQKLPEAEILLLGLALPQWVQGERVLAFRNLFTDLAKKNNIAIVPDLLEGVLGMQQFNIYDGVHPNEQGYKIIAGNVWPVLTSLVNKLPVKA